MLLDEREIALLARFFAKRFPEATDRKPLLDRAGLSDSVADGPAAWEEIVAQAQEQKALGRLGKALRVEDVDDPNLHEVRQLLAYEPGPRWSVPASMLGAGSALAVVLVGGAAWALGGRLLQPEVEAHAAPIEVVATAHAAPLPEATAEGTDEPVAEPAIEPVAAAPIAEPTPVVAAPVAVVAPPVAGADRHVAPDHCARKDGSVTGWWYVGTEMPGKAGDVIVVPHDAYVRAEVPSTKNGWNTRTAVTCVLYAGDRVRLDAAPVPVPVGAWWVSTSADDVIVAGGKKTRDRG